MKDEVELVKEIAILENIYFRRNEDMLLDVLYEVHRSTQQVKWRVGEGRGHTKQ